MTPESKAEQLIHDHWSRTSKAPLKEAIAKALKSERNKALEEAAKLADANKRGLECQYVAIQIRALKSGGGDEKA